MTTGITFGAFDLLHAGHLHFLSVAAMKCDNLIVGLQTNPSIERESKNSPIQTMYERWAQLNCLDFVYSIIPYDTERDVENILCTQYNINYRFLGSDYFGKSITGEDICTLNNIKLVYIPRLHNYSSTELRNRIANAYR